jgi:BTB/POZ domain
MFGSCKPETLNIQLVVENRPSDVAVEGKLAHFSKMLDDQLLTDVNFIVGGRKFGAHLAVLVAASPVMAAMFGRENYLEGQSKTARIDDVDPEVFLQMLRYLYTGVAPKMSKYVEDLFAVADKYQISTLKMECEQLMVSSLKVDNVVRRLELAYAHSASTLLEAALEHVTQHLDDIWNRPEWKELGEKNYHVFFLAMDRVHLKENSKKLEHVPPPEARRPILASPTPVQVSALENVLQAIVRALP